MNILRAVAEHFFRCACAVLCCVRYYELRCGVSYVVCAVPFGLWNIETDNGLKPTPIDKFKSLYIEAKKNAFNVIYLRYSSVLPMEILYISRYSREGIIEYIAKHSKNEEHRTKRERTNEKKEIQKSNSYRKRTKQRALRAMNIYGSLVFFFCVILLSFINEN